MDNENIKKVNNEGEPENQQSREAFDEIMSGMADLAEKYGGESDRERELRERDEKRRKEEMDAIKEDIERRYSLQLEEAKSNMDSIMGRRVSSPASAESDSVSDLNEMIDMDAIRAGDEESKRRKKREKKEKKKKEKIPVYIDLDEKNGIYRALYSLGDVVVKNLARLLGFIFHLIAIPVYKLKRYISRVTYGTKRKLRRQAKSNARELVYFRQEIKSANRYLRRALKHPLSIPGILGHYIGKAFTRHKKLLTTAVNIALPVAALFILFSVFNYWNNVTFALNVIYNDKSIGYITDESVFTEARDMVIDRLSANTVNAEKTTAAESFNAGYNLALVSLDELKDARTISDEMIKNSAENLINACGIYIDGDFICAVKNESDAKTVFYKILEPYEEDARINGYVISFAEDIDYVQGLYPDNETIVWDASKLERTILGVDGATAYYSVMEGDTIASIAGHYGTTAEYISEINNNMTDETMEEGDLINVPSYNKMVNIKKTVTSSRIAAIPFRTIKQRDATKYSGYRVVKQKGADGTQRIITTKVYINNELEDTSIRNEVLTESTEEIVIVGTMTTYGGIYIGEASESGFLWPAPNCHYISSPYGWRSSGWHKGVDLCTTNGTALGSPVIAAKGGTVEMVQRSNSGYGNMVLINHGDGYKTRYAHMVAGSITVNPGDHVEAGQSIGKVGSTGNSSGPHLHFEVIYNSETQNPINYIS